MIKEFIYQNQKYIISIGKNKTENWGIIDGASSDDLWFHLNDFPSPHVILKTNNLTIDEIPNEVIKECCLLCKQYSKYKNMPNDYLKIIYTPVYNIKKGEDIGSVVYKSMKKLLFQKI
jgi:predicted ribosome quality control (RQC) complex YloA/Tae2 family protein